MDLEAKLKLAEEAAQRGDLAKAQATAEDILAGDPNQPDALYLLGILANERGDLDAAIGLLERASAADPEASVFHATLGALRLKVGRLPEAIASFEAALKLDPDFPEPRKDIASAHALMAARATEAGKFNEGLESAARAVEFEPDQAMALGAAGVCFFKLGRYDEALATVERVLAKHPDYAEGYNTLGTILIRMGEVESAIKAYARAAEIQPTWAVPASNVLLSMNYLAKSEPVGVYQAHLDWAKRHATAATITHSRGDDASRKLRIGFVSGDFHSHPVARFILPLFAEHDRGQFEFFAYSKVLNPDAWTAKLQRHVPNWRSIAGQRNDQAAEVIRADQIDVLIDLAGHTGDTLPLLAMKPAPVQATYLGYPNTTGLAAMDYRITDAVADPPGMTDAFNCEKLVRLDPCAWCFVPDDATPDVAPPPSRRSQGVRFGSFNSIAKITQPMIEAWSWILMTTPRSRLILKAFGLYHTSAHDRIAAAFGKSGIDRSRIEFRPATSDYRSHLASYADIDIALDTSPYNGTTTTCEALWMGVPVIAFAGTTHNARVGASLLSAAGLGEFVADSMPGYIRLATALAANHEQRERLRGSLRPKLAASKLCDAKAFAATFGAALRAMWREHCESGS